MLFDYDEAKCIQDYSCFVDPNEGDQHPGRSLPMRFGSVRCVFSMFNPLVISALKADSIYQRTLYAGYPSSGILKDAMISSLGLPRLFLIFEADRYHSCTFT